MMRTFFVILYTVTLCGMGSLSAQCPGKDSILSKLSFLDQNNALTIGNKLTELLKFENQIKKCFQKNDSTYTIVLERIGNLYARLGDFLQAIKYTKQSLTNDSGMTENWVVRNYYFLNNYYDSLKLEKQKNEAIDSCIAKEIRANKEYGYTSILLLDKVAYLYYRGEYSLCYNYASLGEKLIQKYYHASDSISYIIFFITYQTDALYSLNKFIDAEELLISKKNEFLKGKDRYNLSVIYGLLGFVNKSKKDYKAAIDYFKKSSQHDLGAKKNEIRAQALYQMGKIYFENYSEINIALQCYYRALPYSDNVDSFYIFGNIANVHAKTKNYDSAYLYFQKAFNKIKPGINEKDLLSNMEEYVNANTVEYVLNIVVDKADTYLQQYVNTNDIRTLNTALDIYKTADRLLNNVKAGQAVLESKLFWRSYAVRLYEHAIEASRLLGNMNTAFYFFEKSRAVLLDDQLNQQNKINNDDILIQAQIKKKVLLLERERNTTDQSSNRYTTIQNDLLICHQELERSEQSIKTRNPLYYQSFFDTSFVTLTDVRKNLLKDHQALLELFAGDSAVYSLLITSSSTYFTKINKKDFDSTSQKYISYISNQSLLNRRFGDYAKTASHLYELIFPKDKLPAGRIIISPDGRYFPFEALVTNANASSPVYFLKDHAVSYTYSARYLMNDFTSNSSTAAGSFLGVAPVHYAADFSLAPLEGSDESLKKIGSYFNGSKNAVAGHATRNNFLQQFSKYKIIQLYTHAADSSKNGEPVIYFADSALFLSELIPETKPNTRLIVLAACETGNGKLYQGEGVFSFNRGFASLGIPSSVINLWSVDNESTYRITEEFYKYLSEGMPVDMALQKAKLEFMEHGSKENNLPFYWAAAIVAGKTDGFEFNQPFPWKMLVLIIVFAGLSFLLAWGWRNSKRKTG